MTQEMQKMGAVSTRRVYWSCFAIVASLCVLNCTAFQPILSCPRISSFSPSLLSSSVRRKAGTCSVRPSSSSRLTNTMATSTIVTGDSDDFVAASAFTPSPSISTSSSAVGAATTKKAPFLDVLWRFTRPHTFIGTALCIPALHLYAAPTGASLLDPNLLKSIIWALIPAGLINIYITGLNQVTDVEIDKINKPYLPIAAGELSKVLGSIVVIASLIAGLGLGFLPSAFASPALTWVLVASVILGTSYSLPPLRLKRYPVLAALCIIAVRGSVVNMGFYGHALKAAFGQTPGAKPILSLLSDVKCVAATSFFAVFGAVIALMKDVPDIKGDKLNNIRSFSVRAGAGRMFKVGTALMMSLFGGSSVMCLTAAHHAYKVAGNMVVLPVISRSIIALLSLVAGGLVQRKAIEVDPQNGEQVYDFYMYLWKLFYSSYLVLPLAR